MKQAKLIHLEESTILELSIHALKHKLRLKNFIEMLLEEQAKTIQSNNKLKKLANEERLMP